MNYFYCRFTSFKRYYSTMFPHIKQNDKLTIAIIITEINCQIENNGKSLFQSITQSIVWTLVIKWFWQLIVLAYYSWGNERVSKFFTVCFFYKLLNMSPAELKMLADHMGHSLNIHTDHYQLQTSMLERSKVARLLLQHENGGNFDVQGENTFIKELSPGGEMTKKQNLYLAYERACGYIHNIYIWYNGCSFLLLTF